MIPKVADPVKKIRKKPAIGRTDAHFDQIHGYISQPEK
jgi:hypothetical protein